jgi:hypothetical protein
MEFIATRHASVVSFSDREYTAESVAWYHDLEGASNSALIGAGLMLH